MTTTWTAKLTPSETTRPTSKRLEPRICFLVAASPGAAATASAVGLADAGAFMDCPVHVGRAVLEDEAVGAVTGDAGCLVQVEVDPGAGRSRASAAQEGAECRLVAPVDRSFGPARVGDAVDLSGHGTGIGDEEA